jgi:hypothetical protein
LNLTKHRSRHGIYIFAVLQLIFTRSFKDIQYLCHSHQIHLVDISLCCRSTIDYESLGKKDKPNVYEGLENKQGMGLKFKRKQLFLILCYFNNNL